VNQNPEGGKAPGPAAPVAVQVALPASVPVVTYTILALTVIVYLLQLVTGNAHAPDLLTLWGAKASDMIRAGQLWRLITPVLLHASPEHIIFNMYALLVFGTGLERNFGHWRFLALYLLAGFTGNVLSFLLSEGYSVGASTAIFGLVAAEGVFLYQNRGLFGRQFGRAIGNVIFVVAVNLFLGLSPAIDNWGHVGGLLGGLVFTLFAGPIWEVRQSPLASGGGPSLVLGDRREPREVITGAAVVLLIFGALAVWGLAGR